MQPDTRAKLMNRIKRNEDFKSTPYVDTRGNLTVGFGRALYKTPMSIDEAEYLLIDDIKRAEAGAFKYYPGYSDLNEARKSVIVEMAFELGVEGLLQFKGMITATKAGDFKQAAVEMLSSAWHQQVGNRAVELANVMDSGAM